MKTILTSLAILLSLTIHAQFSGYFDPGNWTLTHSSTCDNGYVVTTGAPASIEIFGSDNAGCFSSSPIITRYIIAVEACGTISFDWDYTTHDRDGSSFDRFGYMLNGTPTQLSANGQPNGSSQSGSTSVSVDVGDVFAFYIDATDNQLGRGSSIISDFSGPSCDLDLTVEAPATLYYGYGPLSCTDIIATASSSNGPITITGTGEVCATEPGCFDVIVTATDEACCEVSVTVTVPVVDAVCHDSNGNPKVQVCHKGKSICVSANAVPAHLAHGDYLGDCGETSDCEEAPLMQGSSDALSSVATKKEAQIQSRSSFVIPSLEAFASNEHQQSDFKYVDISPNPAKDVINLTVNRGLNGPTDIIVYNLNGQIVMTSNVEIFTGTPIQLNISDLNTGNYTVKLTDQNGRSLNQMLLVNKSN